MTHVTANFYTLKLWKYKNDDRGLLKLWGSSQEYDLAIVGNTRLYYRDSNASIPAGEGMFATTSLDSCRGGYNHGKIFRTKCSLAQLSFNYVQCVPKKRVV